MSEDEIKRLHILVAALREWIVLADNRLEIADCPQCVAVARTYLQQALATTKGEDE